MSVVTPGFRPERNAPPLRRLLLTGSRWRQASQAPRRNPEQAIRIVCFPDSFEALPAGAGRSSAHAVFKHTTRTVPARLDAIEHRLDVTTLGHEPADELELNAIGRVRLCASAPR